jgi:hypothetical protein
VDHSRPHLVIIQKRPHCPVTSSNQRAISIANHALYPPMSKPALHLQKHQSAKPVRTRTNASLAPWPAPSPKQRASCYFRDSTLARTRTRRPESVRANPSSYSAVVARKDPHSRDAARKFRPTATKHSRSRIAPLPRRASRMQNPHLAQGGVSSLSTPPIPAPPSP